MIISKIPHAYFVDDDKITLSLCKFFNNSVNFCSWLDCFNNPFEALEELKAAINVGASIPDIIFLDINMPFVDGRMFLERLESINLRKIPSVIILSSSIDENDIKKSMDYSLVKGFISKPLTTSKINGLIEHLNNKEVFFINTI